MENTAASARRATPWSKDLLLFRKLIFLFFEAFAVCSFLCFSLLKDTEGALLSLLSAALYLLIYGTEELLHCRMNTVFYVFALLYATGPLLGDGYKFYHLFSGYDKLLHTSAGVVFAVLGSYLPVLINRKYKDDLLMRSLFALSFSMAISVLWEFCEFGADMLLGWDTQNDTVIHSIHSYLLDPAPGVQGSIHTIESVVINGEVMEGYLDIGLIDTMMDMLVEALGAVLYVVVFALDRDAHPMFEFDATPPCRTGRTAGSLMPGRSADALSR